MTATHRDPADRGLDEGSGGGSPVHDPAAPGPEQEGRGVLPRSEWGVVAGFAGVWLIFLVSAVIAETVVRIHDGDRLGLLLLLVTSALFCLTYLAAFIAPRPLTGLPAAVNTAGYTAVLGLLTIALFGLMGGNALNCLPYLTAVWLFSYNLRTAIVSVALGALLAVTLAVWLTEGTQRFWVTGAMLVGFAVMAVVRVTTEREESMRDVQHELDLSRQREVLARDVHDVLGHSLTAVHVKAQLVARLIDADPARAKDEAEQIAALARTAIGEVRSTVDGLAAPQLVTELAGARRVLSDAGIRADVPGVEAAAEVPEPAAGLFAWALREAVTNAVRHSGADRVRVRLAPDRLVVVDDGVGPDGTVSGHAQASGPSSGSTVQRGTGLAGLRARTEAAGGTLQVGPEHPGTARPGTRLEVTL